MIKFRWGVHETNSSSQHVLMITKNNTHVTLEELLKHDYSSIESVFMNNKGEIDLFGINEGFERSPLDFLVSLREKVAYALSAYCGYYSHPRDIEKFTEDYNRIRDVVRDIIPGFVDFHIYKRDIDIYKDKEGNELDYRDLEYEGYNEEKRTNEYSYIDADGNKQIAILDEENVLELPDIGPVDHQSMGLLQNFLKEKNIDLKEFLTNKRYVVVIDGDEREDLKKMIKANIIDMNFVEEIYDHYGDEDM